MRGQSCFSFCDLVLQSSLSVGNNIGGYGGSAECLILVTICMKADAAQVCASAAEISRVMIRLFSAHT